MPNNPCAIFYTAHVFSIQLWVDNKQVHQLLIIVNVIKRTRPISQLVDNE